MIRWLSNFLRPRSFNGPGPERLPQSADLFTEGNPDSVEAWLREEIAFWAAAAERATQPSKQKTWGATELFYRARLAEHLERRADDSSQS